MTSYSNDFSGGTNTVAITAANSGGASGDAFTSVTQGDGVTFDNTHVYGSMACKIATGSAISCPLWTPASAFGNGTFWLLLYIPTGATIGSNFTIGGFYSGSTVRVRLSISTTLKLVINSAAGGTATSTNSIPTNQFCLIEMTAVLASGTGGSSTVNLYSTPTSASPLESFGQTGVNYGGTADRIRLGKGTAPSTPAPDFWFGMAKANDTGATFGPLSSSIPANVAAPAGAAVGAATSPGVTGQASVGPPAAPAVGSATSPGVTYGISVSPPAGSSVGAATSPAVSAAVTVTMPAGAATGAAVPPAVTITLTLAPPAGAATADAASPTVGAAVTIPAPSGTATAAATPPTVTYATQRDLTLISTPLPDRWTSTPLAGREYATAELADRRASTPLPDRWTSTQLPERFAATALED